MLYRKGADPEALERTARELTACAAEVDGIRSTGTRALAVIGRSWGGDDAQSAQDRWRTTSASLVALGSTLETMSRRLTDNARAQRGTSAIGVASPGPLAPTGLFPWLGGAGTTGADAVTAPAPLADQVRGRSPARAIASVVRPTPATRASSAPRAATVAAAEATHGSHPSGPWTITASWCTGADVEAVAPGPRTCSRIPAVRA